MTDSTPQRLGGVKYLINRTIQLCNYVTVHVLWPSAWNMVEYKGIRIIEPIALYFRDPMN